MMPALLILRMGTERGVPLPLPLFLLWPFAALTALICGPPALLLPARTKAGAACRGAICMLATLWHLHGLKVDGRSKRAGRVFLWFV